MSGEVLRLLRVFNNIKATDLAAQLGISKSYLSEIEHNKKQPTIDLLDKYADILHIKTSTLLLFSEALDDDPEIKKDPRRTVAKAAVKWLQILNKVGHVDEDDEDIPNKSKSAVSTS